MKTLTILLSLAPLVTMSGAAAADALPKQVKNMHCLVGTWRATGTLTMGKDVAKVNATWACKRTSGDYGVLCNLELKGVPGLAVYRETDLFGFDPGTNTYHWFSVTNAGETHDHGTAYTEGDTLQFVYSGRQEGKPFKEVIDMKFAKNAKSMSIRSETFVDGASTAVLDISANK